MATHTNVIDIESFFMRISSSRNIRTVKGVDSFDLLRDTFRFGTRSLPGGENVIKAPRTKPIEFWWEHENINGFIVNRPVITITPSNISTDKVTVKITNWGDSDEQLYAVTPL